MLTVQEVKTAIQALSPEDFAHLRKWISELDWDEWDEEIIRDSDSGKLDFLIDEALTQKAENKLMEL